MLLLFSSGWLNDHLFGKEQFIRFTVRVFRERVIYLCVCASFTFGFEGGIWDLIVLIPDHSLSNYFALTCKCWMLAFLTL